ncbi:hypothetical protein HNQ03_002710 [Chryseobacterium sp. 16F]|uniref:Uncharacterized protein n=2 Tax=Frigoriflavimonas asaccharolytica TaxID=2735899 RepID=A0A8J8KCG6_9FLAO|nr:hypothetical protein [Frigoriflavimonas asaccharolytica]
MYFVFGTLVSFLLQYFLIGSQGWALDLYYAAAFGAAWGIAFYLDTPRISLPKKLGFSFLAMAILAGIGTLIFNLEMAIPSIMKFSIVFVAYYLLASFKGSKSLRR